MTQPPLELEVYVSGTTRQFPEKLWREAIQYFLSVIWRGRGGDDASIDISGILLMRKMKFYVAFGGKRHEWPDEVPKIETRPVSCSHESVEQGLVRFVRDNQMRHLVICLNPVQTFLFWKYPERGRLGVALIDNGD